jgi:acyl dehydratase
VGEKRKHGGVTSALSYTVNAFNTATESANKIHDDTVARNLGFRGGLVPGVDVYAYLCHPPAEAWGVDWLERGTMTARFAAPVYDGDDVTVTGSLDAMTLTDSNGGFCASAAASLPGGSAEPPSPDDWPDFPADGNRTPASPDAFTSLPMGYLEVGFHAEPAQSYLDDIREHATLFRQDGYAHPGWLLRYCNFVLTANFVLGPWIHVESTTQFLSPLTDGERLQTRARVSGVSEKGGHRFVDLDILQLADAKRPVARVSHRAIYQPRGV